MDFRLARIDSFRPRPAERRDSPRLLIAANRKPASIFDDWHFRSVGLPRGASLGLTAKGFVGERQWNVGHDILPIIDIRVVITADIDERAAIIAFREPVFQELALLVVRRLKIIGKPDDGVEFFDLRREAAKGADAIARPAKQLA